jgi:hypothetical protein
VAERPIATKMPIVPLGKNPDSGDFKAFVVQHSFAVDNVVLASPNNIAGSAVESRLGEQVGSRGGDDPGAR